MKKIGLKIFIALSFFLFVSFLTGCAKTGDGDIFRFEVRELELTVGDSRNLKLVLGEQEDDAEICFIISEVGSDPFDSENTPITNVISLEKSTITVGESIKVSALNEGEVYLTAYIKGNQNVSDTIVVTVNKQKLTAMQAVPVKDKLNITETTQFTVTTFPNTISNAVTYSSSDETVGTITADGLFTALAVGTTYITVTSVYDSTVVVVKEMTVIYNNTEDIAIESENVNLVFKQTYQINATALPNVYPNLANPTLKYESSNESIVTVDQNGLVTAVGVCKELGEDQEGYETAVVTITSADGVQKEIVFFVEYTEATEIIVTKDEERLETECEFTLAVKEKLVLTIKVGPESAEPKFTILSSDEEIVTVTNTGTITAKAEGTTNVVIYAGDVEFVINITVANPDAE